MKNQDTYVQTIHNSNIYPASLTVIRSQLLRDMGKKNVLCREYKNVSAEKIGILFIGFFFIAFKLNFVSRSNKKMSKIVLRNYTSGRVVFFLLRK